MVRRTTIRAVAGIATSTPGIALRAIGGHGYRRYGRMHACKMLGHTQGVIFSLESVQRRHELTDAQLEQLASLLLAQPLASGSGELEMDVYVVADMEGVSGIVNPQQVIRGEPEFLEGRRLLAGDINAAVAGAFDGGATRVVVGDIHASQRNLPIELLDPRAEYETPPTPDLSTLRDGFASLVIIGMHAMSGTSRAFPEHTIEPA